MSQFKAGDLVKCIRSLSYQICEDKVYEVMCILDGGAIMVRADHGGGHITRASYFILAPTPTAKKSYKFQSVNPNDIDWRLIASEATKGNPLILVDNGINRWIYIHQSILDKAELITGRGVSSTLSTFTLMYLSTEGVWVGLSRPSDIEVVKEWVSEVKRAQWPDGNKTTVRVSFLKV